MPADRQYRLDLFRANTDAALDAISQQLRADDTSWADRIPGQLRAVRRELAAVRQQIDSLITQPIASRTEADLNRVVHRLIAVIPQLSSSLNVMEAQLAQASPDLTDLITAARAATEMRDFAGQLGSALTSAVAGRRPMTGAETALADRITGHFDALNEEFRLAYAKLGSNAEIDHALGEIEEHFFGIGVPLAHRLAESGRMNGAYSMSTTEFRRVRARTPVRCRP